MLQALNKHGDLILPSKLTLQEVNNLRNELFYCPHCKDKVIIRAGPKVIPHFAHLPKSSCRMNGTGESKYHQQAKLLLYAWLQGQSFQKVYLEKYIPKIKQRPDILIETGSRVIAVEFQSATISPNDIYARNDGYARANIFPLWILGKNQLPKRHRSAFHHELNTFTQIFIKQYRKQGPSQLLYFCPMSEQFTTLNDIYLYRPNRALAFKQTRGLHDVHLRQLFFNNKLSKHYLYNHWYREKQRFRLASYRVHGRELRFRQWLYEQGLHVEQLPSVIHLPISSQYKMSVPTWHWQSKLVIELLHPLPIGSTITTSMCKGIMKHYINKRFIKDIQNIIKEYFIYLQTSRIFIEIGDGIWKKTREFKFHRYIEQSLRADRLLIDFLKQS